MESTLGWIELSADALRRMRAELENDGQGVVDELGVLSLHTGYADRFFPGTSVLHTRARYLFFVCWNYLIAKDNKVSRASFGKSKEEAEGWVTRQLRRLEPRPDGIIGSTIYPRPPAQPIDFIYWSALRTFGFYRGPDRARLAKEWNHEQIEFIADDRGVELGDETVRGSALAAFHCPPAPHYWGQSRPRTQLDCDLTKREAEFLKNRLLHLDRACLLTEAARLLPKARPRRDTVLWDDPLIREAAEPLGLSEMLPRARQASYLAYLVRAVYGGLVEKVARETDPDHEGAAESGYRDRLESLCETAVLVEDVKTAPLDAIFQDVLGLSPSFRELLSQLQLRVSKARGKRQMAESLLSSEVEALAGKVERQRKGERRARLPRTPAGLERRRDFADTTVSAYGLDYRWAQVRRLLEDLAKGLAA